MAKGKLQADPVFLGLTRPAMFLGVTYLWGMLEVFASFVYFINTSDFMAVFYFAIMHVIGIVITAKEPRMVEILMIGAQTNFICRNKAYHGNTSSFDVF